MDTGDNDSKIPIKYMQYPKVIPNKKKSSPESKMAMTVPRPSYSGYLAKNDVAPVSIRGCNAQTGKSSILSAGFVIFPLSV